MRIYAYECRKCGRYTETRSRVTPVCTNPDTRCNTTMSRTWTAPNLSSQATPTRKGQR